MVLKMTSPFAWLGAWKTLLSYSTRSPRNGLTVRPGTHSRRSRAGTGCAGRSVARRQTMTARPRPFTLGSPGGGCCWRWQPAQHSTTDRRYSARSRGQSSLFPPPPRRSTRGLELPPPALPLGARRDPERQGDQLEVQPEALLPDVQEVEPELLPARNAPCRVDLGHARETGSHAVPRVVAGNRLERHEVAVPAELDLRGQECPRAHEAHVALEDVPELGQLVQGRRPEKASHPRHPCVAMSRLTWPELGVRVRHHGAEFQAREAPPAPAHTLLRVEDRPTVLEFDGGGDERPQWRGREQPHRGEARVEGPLETGRAEVAPRRAARHPVEERLVRAHLRPPVEVQRSPAGIGPEPFDQDPVLAQGEDLPDEVVGVARPSQQPAAVPPGDRGDLGRLFRRRYVRTPGGQDPVELARHDVAGEPPLERDHEHVGAGERLPEPGLRLV